MTTNTTSMPRAWIYARVPGNYDETNACFKACWERALADGCNVSGGAMEYTNTWATRRSYQDMIRHIRDGKVDRVYICRMRQLSGKERTLFSFFKCAMQYGIKVCTLDYRLADRLASYRLGRMVESYAAKNDLPLPWDA